MGTRFSIGVVLLIFMLGRSPKSARPGEGQITPPNGWRREILRHGRSTRDRLRMTEGNNGRVSTIVTGAGLPLSRGRGRPSPLLTPIQRRSPGGLRLRGGAARQPRPRDSFPRYALATAVLHEY